MQGHDCGLETA